MLHPKMAHVYVGVDTHRQTHTATIIDCFFEKLGGVTFRNRTPDFVRLEDEVGKHLSDGVTPIYGLEDCVAVGRELTIYLLGKGHIVKYVNPSLTKNERVSQASLHKTDSFDSLCVARILLSKLGQLPDAQVDDKLWALTSLVTKRASLVRAGVRVKNQLHGYLSHHYPSYRRFFHVFDCKTALAFWEKYPSPSWLRGVGIIDFTKFLQKESNNVYTIEKACEILKLVTEDGYVDSAMQEVSDTVVSLSVRQLRANNELIETLEARIRALVPEFGYKLHTMKGIDYTTAAALIAEIGDINRFSSPAKLAAYAGISPAEYSSGQSERNISNKRGNRNLNQLIFHLAVSQCNGSDRLRGGPFNSIFVEYYQKKITEGKTKKQAIKCVMRRLVNIIYRLMKDKCEYRPPLNHRAKKSR